METWYHCPVCQQGQSLKDPCHHRSLEREIARLSQRMVAELKTPVRVIRVRWDVTTARFIATLRARGRLERATAWGEDEVKTAGPAREQVVRARLAGLLRGPAGD